jgi:cysteine desulfurase
VAQQIALRNRLHHGLVDRVGGIALNGHATERLPNTVNLSFSGTVAGAVMAAMPDIAVSSGSACTSAVPMPSHVLTAMGLSFELAEASLRFSVGEPTTTSDIDIAVERIAAAVTRVRHTMGTAIAPHRIGRDLR